GVVGFGPAPGPAVLTRRVGALLEVLDRLGCQGDAESAGGTHLAARTVLRSHVLLPVVVGERHTISHDWADVRGQLQADHSCETCDRRRLRPQDVRTDNQARIAEPPARPRGARALSACSRTPSYRLREGPGLRVIPSPNALNAPATNGSAATARSRCV